VFEPILSFRIRDSVPVSEKLFGLCNLTLHISIDFVTMIIVVGKRRMNLCGSYIERIRDPLYVGTVLMIGGNILHAHYCR